MWGPHEDWVSCTKIAGQEWERSEMPWNCSSHFEIEVDGTNGVGAFRQFEVASFWHFAGSLHSVQSPGSRNVFRKIGALQITERDGLCFQPLILFAFLLCLCSLSFTAPRLFMFEHVLCRSLSWVARESTTAWIPPCLLLWGLWLFSNMTVFPGIQEKDVSVNVGILAGAASPVCLLFLFSPSGPADSLLFFLVTSEVASGPQILFFPNCISVKESHTNRGTTGERFGRAWQRGRCFFIGLW